ncbi:unnamed protein product [Caenorhabditis angaria]|uniref:Uncharacterized protein n=1 Tax=Caenorhabditis angaria TaxID=860376 RepID=A0A9P1ID00_9PELO|nr:unnamed protein product [Caenorhabditis angaria]
MPVGNTFRQAVKEQIQSTNFDSNSCDLFTSVSTFDCVCISATTNSKWINRFLCHFIDFNVIDLSMNNLP